MPVEAAIAPVAAVAPAITESVSAAGGAGIEAAAGGLANVGGEIGGGLTPEVASLTADLTPKIDAAPLAGIQDVANVDIPGTPAETQAPILNVGVDGIPTLADNSPDPKAPESMIASERSDVISSVITSPAVGTESASPTAPGSSVAPEGDAHASKPLETAAEKAAKGESPWDTKTTEASNPTSENPAYAITNQEQDLLDLEKSGGPMSPEQKQALEGLHTRIDEKVGTSSKGEAPNKGTETNNPTGNGKGPEAPTDTADKADATVDSKDKDPKQAEKNARVSDLEQRVKDGKATAEELKELRELKKDPAQRRKDLEQKAMDGTISDTEAEELGKMNQDSKDKPAAEQTAEELDKEVDKLAADLMNKMANGEQLTPQDYENLRAMREKLMAKQLKNEGITPEDAKAVIDKAMKGSGNERQMLAMKEVQKQLQELMAIELQMRSLPKNVNYLRAQRAEMKKAANQAHKDAEASSGDERIRKKQLEYTSYMQIANVNAQIVKIKYMVPVMDARRQDLEQSVRRRLGVSNGLGALVEWGSAKVRNIYTEVGVGVAEEMDYKTGSY